MFQNPPMLRSLIAAIAAKLRRVGGPGSSLRSRKLADERRGHFFSWFHFDPVGDPAPTGSARPWHCFRPSGEAFHAFVELDVLIDQSGRILESCLGLDRAFVEHPRNGAFARDLTKSYLQWGLDKPADPPARALIENIAQPAAGGVPVLMHARAMPPAPGEDATGGYLVYLGKGTSAEVIVGDWKLTMTNMPGPFPDRRIFAALDRADEAPPDTRSRVHRWLRLDFSPAITLH